MNETNEVPASEPAAVVEAPVKRKAGRPKKTGVKLGVKPRRDAFRDAFGHPKAAAAVKAIRKDSQDRKDIVAAVKSLSKSGVRTTRLEGMKKKLVQRIDKAQKRLAEIDAEIAQLASAGTTIEKFRPKIMHLLDTLGYKLQHSLLENAPEAAPAPEVI